MSDMPPQQRIDHLLSKSGILKGFLWAGGGLLIAILGNYITRWLDQYIVLLPTITGHNSALSQINFSWLPPLSIMLTALILGFVAYLFVQRAQQDAVKWKDCFKTCKKKLEESNRTVSELAIKLDGTRAELKRYQNSPPGVTQREEKAALKANIVKPSHENIKYSELVEILDKEEREEMKSKL